MFVTLLNEHLKLWPQTESANQARFWLGNHLQTEQQWEQALAMYAAVQPTSPLFPDALKQTVRNAERHLASLSSAHQRTTFANQVLAQLQEIQQQTSPTKPANLHALLANIEMGTRYSQQEPMSWIQPLRQAIANCNDPNLRSSAQAWLLALEAFNPTPQQPSEPLLTSIQQYPALLKTAEQAIADIGQHHPALVTEQAHTIRQTIIESALHLPLSQTESTAWLSRKANALQAAGRDTEALSVLEELEKQHPRNAKIQLQIARLLTRAHQADSPQKPLIHWRRLAAQLKPHTKNWYEAKYHVALLLEKSGQKADARKLLEYLQAIPPGWDNSAFKNKFEQLLLSL